MENNPLKDKKILFFSPLFFNYAYIIKRKMEDLGAEVIFYDELSINGAWNRALLKIVPFFFHRHTNKYYDEIIQKHKDERFDYIFVIKCSMMTGKVLKQLKYYFPDAFLSLYLYDSIKNVKEIKRKIKHFDFVSSFDKSDCEKEGNMVFRPLFFADEFADKNEPKEYEYDLAFCGTIHADRYDILKKIEKQSKEKNYRFYKFYYLQSKFIYYFYKNTKKSFHNTTIDEFSFVKKSQKEIAEKEKSSRIIIDIQHPKQTGLTMRTIEMLGMGKKLVTTNSNIVSYDFYCPNNICVISRKEPNIDEAFMKSDYQDIPYEIYKKYSLKNWLYDVLNIGVDTK